MPNEDERIAALLKMAGPRPAVSPEVTRRVRLAVHDAWSDEIQKNSRKRTAMWAGVAAAAALTIGIRLQLRPVAESTVAATVVAEVQLVRGAASFAAGTVVKSGSVIATKAGGFATLNWHEHGSLRLAEDTVVRFDSTDAITLQRGAVYYASVNAKRTIAVATKFGTVHDIGTQFEARIASDSLRVRVREGEIRLADNNATAGTELTASRDGVKRRSIPTSGADWNWVLAAAPPMMLDGNAREVLSAIAREKGLKLTFIDRSLADSVAKMSLHSRTPLTPDEGLGAATTASNLAYRISGDTLTIERRRTR